MEWFEHSLAAATATTAATPPTTATTPVVCVRVLLSVIATYFAVSNFV